LRTIFIGDIHGCIEELRELLDRLAPSADDQVISLGDIVAKGPASEECIGLLRDLRCNAVLGNQDQKWARWRWRTEAVHWLLHRPLYIDLPDRGVLAVHAGVLPWMGLDRLDAQRETLTTLRFVRRDPAGAWSVVPKGEEREGDVFWADLWDGERTVVYGHAPTPSREPSMRPKAIGIDTGCVYGGRLTAAILSDGTWSFESVQAKRAYARR
jgi:hypothetical protein